MKVQLNGKEVTTAAANLQELLKEIPDLPEYYAVARNDEIIPREKLADTPVADGDVIEVFSFMAGGSC